LVTRTKMFKCSN